LKPSPDIGAGLLRCISVLACLALSGCAQFGSQLSYYAQAAQGQYALWSDARPVDAWLGDPALDPVLKARLQQAQKIRRFAVSELGLPDNGSYQRYAALKRPFVVWNVVATPELSLEPVRWCFPIAGCVSYRGYYRHEQALAYASVLRGEGKDVRVGGVPAYSTLGWFDDPLLSTFIHYPDAELARLLFHELAHQVLYVAGDTPFNEAFATAVEEAGVARWLESHGDDAMRESYQRYAARRQDFIALLEKHRLALAATYAKNMSDRRKRKRKARIMASLQNDYQTLKLGWGNHAGYDRWFSEPVTNAHLVSVAAYNDLLPGFRALLLEQQTLPRFYAAVIELARQPQLERTRLLERTR
jgi:predicted aminopeptidase